MKKRLSINCINVRNTFRKIFYPLKDNFKIVRCILNFLIVKVFWISFLLLKTDAMSRYLRDQNKHCL